MKCQNCQADMIKKGDYNQKFCSASCQKESYYRSLKEKTHSKVNICVHCQKEFIGTKKKFCSVACQKQATYIKRRGIIPESAKCKHCSKDFRPICKTQVYCSRECNSKAWNTNPKKRAYINEYFKSHPRKYYPKPKQNYSLIYIVKCEVTGKLFVARRKTVKISREGHRLKERILRAPLTRTCGICGNEFTRSYNETICSETCRKQSIDINRKRSRAKKYGALILERINRIEVFNCYNWHCAICRCPTPREKMGLNEYDAPTLDHITPISKGGQHTTSNVQLACWLCNTAKSNMELDDNTETPELELIKEYIKLNKLIYEKQREVNHC
jgi:predicted nucleic acid-binding Zn ribbon protein